MYEASLSDFIVKYDGLDKNYLVNALIPPAGDSSRLTYKWANELRALVDNQINKISDNDKCVISGLSYWHVDRKEIDSLLAKISVKNVDAYMVNPHPPKALSAVLTCVLPKHITYSSSKWIGGLIDGRTHFCQIESGIYQNYNFRILRAYAAKKNIILIRSINAVGMFGLMTSKLFLSIPF